MIVIIEGMDATGKSTLAHRIHTRFGWRVQPSEGPPKYSGEINERIRRYFTLHNHFVIYDRHPCISQPIYSQFRGGDEVDPTLIEQIYSLSPFIIYCRNHPNNHYTHLIKSHDSPEHITMIDRHSPEIQQSYDLWGLEHAHMIYHIGDPHQPIVAAIAGAL